jgi:hypothetical protein
MKYALIVSLLLLSPKQSSSLSTLIYTILQIAGSLKYFLIIFFILIVCFADMIQIVTKVILFIVVLLVVSWCDLTKLLFRHLASVMTSETLRHCVH